MRHQRGLHRLVAIMRKRLKLKAPLSTLRQTIPVEVLEEFE